MWFWLLFKKIMEIITKSAVINQEKREVIEKFLFSFICFLYELTFFKIWNWVFLYKTKTIDICICDITSKKLYEVVGIMLI